MLCFFLLRANAAEKAVNAINFDDKDCKNLNQWDHEDYIEISSEKEICVDAESNAFVIHDGKGRIIMTDENGVEYKNAYGGYQGKYLVKTDSTEKIVISFGPITLIPDEYVGAVNVKFQYLLVTRKNWNSQLKLDLDFRSETNYDMTVTNFVVFNDDNFKATVTPNENAYVYIDQEYPKNTAVSVSDRPLAILSIDYTDEYKPPTASMHLTADVTITSEAQTLPRKVIKIQKGVFHEGCEDLSEEPEEPDPIEPGDGSSSDLESSYDSSGESSDDDKSSEAGNDGSSSDDADGASSDNDNSSSADNDNSSSADNDNSSSADNDNNSSADNDNNSSGADNDNSSGADNDNEDNNDSLNTNPNDPSLSGGEIAGIVIGCIVAVAAIAFVIVWFAVLKKGACK